MPVRFHVAEMPPKARLEALVDGIFAVAMTLLVLDIKVPEGTAFGSNSEMLGHFASVAEAFAIYVVSFCVLAIFWVTHYYHFRFIGKLDRQLFWLNIAFLFLTTTVPFTTNLVSSHGNLSLPITLYAVNLILLGLMLWLQDRHLVACPEQATAEFTPDIAAKMSVRVRLVCLVPLLSIAVAQFSPAWALRSLWLLALMHFVPHGIQHMEDKA